MKEPLPKLSLFRHAVLGTKRHFCYAMREIRRKTGANCTRLSNSVGVENPLWIGRSDGANCGCEFKVLTAAAGTFFLDSALNIQKDFAHLTYGGHLVPFVFCFFGTRFVFAIFYFEYGSSCRPVCRYILIFYACRYRHHLSLVL